MKGMLRKLRHKIIDWILEYKRETHIFEIIRIYNFKEIEIFWICNCWKCFFYDVLVSVKQKFLYQNFSELIKKWYDIDLIDYDILPIYNFEDEEVWQELIFHDEYVFKLYSKWKKHYITDKKILSQLIFQTEKMEKAFLWI